MNAYVINLARSTERRQYMQEQLDSLGIPFEFINAVDGAKMDDEVIEKMKDQEHTEYLSQVMRKGSYACLLSHHSIFQKMVNENIPCATVFEDDAGLSESLKAILNAVEPLLRPSEIVLLYSHNNYQKTVLSKVDAIQIGRHQLVYTMNAGAHSTAVGYIITLEAAKNMLGITSNVQVPFDAWGYYVNKGYVQSLRCVIPYPVAPGKYESDINYVKENSISGKLRQVLHKYRRMFPIAQILEYRRSRYVKKYSAYNLTDEPSPLSYNSPGEG